MSYDSAFYEAYAAYLQEPRVRRVHDMMLSTAVHMAPALQRVVDLGCGQGNEYFHHARPHAYVGLDRNATGGVRPQTIAADYRDPVLVASLAQQHGVRGAVSLFSVECTAPFRDNYRFYEALFASGQFDAILVAGFYYGHAPGQETIGEAGGLVSYQTIEPLHLVVSQVFDEARLSIACPSTLFGEDVVEVWKILTRKASI